MIRRTLRHKSTLRGRLTLILVLLTVIPLGLISVVTLRQTAESGNQLSMASVMTPTRSLSEMLSNDFQYIAAELDVGDSAESTMFLMGAGSETRLKQYTMNMLRAYLNAEQTNPYGQYIKDICVIARDGRAMSLHRGRFHIESPFDDYKMIQEMRDDFSQMYLFAPSVPMYYYGTKTEDITFARGIMHHNRVVGIVSIDVDIELVRATFNKTQGASDYAVLVNHNGEIIVGSQDEMFREMYADNIERILSSGESGGVFPVMARREKYYMSYSESSVNGWYVVTANAAAGLDKPVESIRLSIIMAVLVSLITSLLLSIFVSKRYFLPLSVLKTKMAQAVENNFGIQVSYSGDYEIEQLYDNFNRLLEQSREYMKRIVVEQNNLKRAELQVLQAQINPHFLYNSIDVAVHVAENQQTEEVINLLMALSRYYRIVLSGGMKDVSLDCEIENIRTYLRIMKMQLRELMDYEVNVEGPVERVVRFPKLTLQPIVENAVVHGITGQAHGKIVVTVKCAPEDNGLYICVEDDGIGMTEEQLEAVDRQIHCETPAVSGNRSYGLFNVSQRLSIFFKDKCVFKIDSKPYKGTRVVIRADVDMT